MSALRGDSLSFGANMGSNPFLGVLYHWIGGFASATNFIPFRGIKRWSWEIYWLIQGIAAWLVAPIVLAGLLVPDLFMILRYRHWRRTQNQSTWPSCSGCSGELADLPSVSPSDTLASRSAMRSRWVYAPPSGLLCHRSSTDNSSPSRANALARSILLGIFICLVAVAVNGAAGLSKEREITPEEKAESGERDFSFVKGVLIAIGAGFMSSFFAFGLDAGAPIGAIAKAHLIETGRPEVFQNLPVLVVVLWGGFATNFVWSIILILRNRSLGQFTGSPGRNPMRAVATSGDTLMDLDLNDVAQLSRLSNATLVRNYFFAALAGVIWYFQFFFYSMGQTKMGKYDFSSWTLHMASIIIFATLWGLALKEWKGTSRRTRMLVACGLTLLIGSTLVVGYGNYLKAVEPSATVANR